MRAVWGGSVLILLGAACRPTAQADAETSGPVVGVGAAPTGGSSGYGGTGATGGTGLTGGGGAGSGGDGSGGMPPGEQAQCQGHIYECGDGVDNDGDNLVDSFDPDCLGPCDDDEESYYRGRCSPPPCSVDCYFDLDAGSGNDQCYWDHRCDPLSVAPDYYPEPWEGDQCEYSGPDQVVWPIGQTCHSLLDGEGQLAQCLAYCLPLTPNGCDCFGCCELPAGSGQYVYLGSEGVDHSNPTMCTRADVSDPDVCHPCTPVADCRNECDHCELCLGQTTLPLDCFSADAGVLQCPGGEQRCGLPWQPLCPAGHYCITGCCQPVPT